MIASFGFFAWATGVILEQIWTEFWQTPCGASTLALKNAKKSRTKTELSSHFEILLKFFQDRGFKVTGDPCFRSASSEKSLVEKAPEHDTQVR